MEEHGKEPKIDTIVIIIIAGCYSWNKIILSGIS
jgi:hypothetical protein